MTLDHSKTKTDLKGLTAVQLQKVYVNFEDDKTPLKTLEPFHLRPF